MSAAATTLWARAFVDELARCGVRDVVLAPGSRSTPLVLALAADGRFRLRVHLDERSGAFFALGQGKATGRPTGVVTTSGTATANLLPAVIEASQGETPLLVLTADRPPRLRGADANQAIDQNRLYGSYVRAFFETAQPELDGPAVRHLRALACRAVTATLGPPPGPVHVNMPLDKPLEPVPEAPEIVVFSDAHPLAARGRPDGAPFVAIHRGRREVEPQHARMLTAAVGVARRGVVVAGPSADPERTGPAAVALAAATGFPLLADPLSGARYGPTQGALVVHGYDLFLRVVQVREALTPDLIFRVGASPTSTALQRYLFHHNGVSHVVVDGGGRWKDHGATATEYVSADPADTLAALAPELERRADPGWVDAWARASAAAARALQDAAETGETHEGEICASVVEAMPAGSTLFVSNSMPIRDVDASAVPRADALRVLANRGASGIDGIVSSAFGVGTCGPTACLLGDVAFFHDQNGLLWAREDDAAVVFVLIDNDGGGIFHMLPVKEHEPHFTRYFATPHGLDFRHAAELHAIPLEDVAPEDVGEALKSALRGGGTRILRVRTDRSVSQERRARVADAVAGSVRTVLG